MAVPNSARLEPTFGSKPSNRARLKRSSISILRPILDERHFEENYQSVERKVTFSVPEPIRSAIRPPKNFQQWRAFFFMHIPILHWLWTYKKNFILSDLVAGITIGIMQVSQGLAYSLLAKVPPVYGLYTSFIPPLIYAVFGSSRHLSLGCFTLVCLIIGSGINRVISDNPELHELCSQEVGTMLNGSSLAPDGLTPCEHVKMQLAITIAFMSGLIMILCSFLQLGFVTMFFSDALISGYTTAAGFHALTSQLEYVFDFNMTGVSTTETKAVYIPEIPKIWYETGMLIHDHKTNWNSFLTSLVSFAFLIIVKIVNKKLLPRWKYHKKFPVPIPGALILVIVATLISRLAEFHTEFGVSIVGYIPQTPPPVSVLTPKYIGSTFQDAFIVAIISFSMGVSLSKTFAKKNHYTISANQEFFSYGVANLVGSFFSCFSSSGSLSRTTVADNTGAKTQVVSLLSAAIVLLTLLALGFLLKDLPLAVLAAIVLEALWTLFKQFKDIVKYFKLSKPDMMVWLVTFGATVLLGIDIGLGIGVAFSLFLIIGRIILPPSASLGRAPNTEIFRNRKDFKKVQSLPGILIFRFVAPLCYVNAMVFRKRLVTAAGVDPALALTEEVDGCLMVALKKLKNKASSVRFKDYSRASSRNESHEPSNRASNAAPDDVDPESQQRSGSQENLSPVNLNSPKSDLTPILKQRAGISDEGSSFERLGGAAKRKWKRFIGKPSAVRYSRFTDQENCSKDSKGGDEEGSGSSSEDKKQEQVAIVVEPPSSMDSAIDAEDSDEGTSVKLLQRPKRKRNSDSMDSGDMSDTESQPSSLHLAEMDEVPMMQSSQAFNQFSVVSCVADDAELPLQRNLHTIIIDCAPITFIDSVGAEVMEQIISEYDKIGIQVLLARTGKPNRDMLTRSGFFDRFGKEWLFPSLQDAVNHAEMGVRLRRYVHKVNSKIAASQRESDEVSQDTPMWQQQQTSSTGVKFHIGGSETESLDDLTEEEEEEEEEEQGEGSETRSESAADA